MAVQADVTDAHAVAAMVASVEGGLGRVDILVNNAGITHYVPFPDVGEVTAETWQRIMDVNVTGAFLCSQAVAPGMQARGAGKLVNVASNSALTDAGSSIPYVVSKAALVSLTRCLARRAGAGRTGQRGGARMDAHRVDRPLRPARSGRGDPGRGGAAGAGGGCGPVGDRSHHQRLSDGRGGGGGPRGDAGLAGVPRVPVHLERESCPGRDSETGTPLQRQVNRPTLSLTTDH